MNYTILIVDDDMAINDMLVKYLRKNGYITYSAYSGTEALLFLEKQKVNLIILDLMLPGLSGEQVLAEIKKTKNVPVIGLSAKEDSKSKIFLLKNGADDYVTKPFDIEELLARIETILRRIYENQYTSNSLLCCGDLNLDTIGMEATLKNQKLPLTKNEFAILKMLMGHDLRTPVTAIQGYTQMHLQSPELSEEDLDAAAVINERLNVLNQLLNQLFEFARIEADEMEFSYTTFDLNAVLRSVAVSFFKSFEERKIIPALSIAEISFPFYGDEKAVTRIFENIISNALSHGKSDYHFSSYDDNENYHFSFQNFTDSINESDIDKIFNRFYTTDLSRSRKTTGLGLTIAKNLTVKMGGSISASLNNNVFEIVVCFPKQKG